MGSENFERPCGWSKVAVGSREGSQGLGGVEGLSGRCGGLWGACREFGTKEWHGVI